MDEKRKKERNVGGRRLTTRSQKENKKKVTKVIDRPQEELDMEKYI
jgi:hypothetical protein